MAVNVTIKNIPPKLYKKLKARAVAHRQRVEKMLARIEALRNRVSDAPPLTDEFLRKAKEEGRP